MDDVYKKVKAHKGAPKTKKKSKKAAPKQKGEIPMPKAIPETDKPKDAPHKADEALSPAWEAHEDKMESIEKKLNREYNEDLEGCQKDCIGDKGFLLLLLFLFAVALISFQYLMR